MENHNIDSIINDLSNNTQTNLNNKEKDINWQNLIENNNSGKFTKRQSNNFKDVITKMNHKSIENDKKNKSIVDIIKRDYLNFYYFKTLFNEQELNDKTKYRLVPKEKSKYNRFSKIKTFKDYETLNPVEAIKLDKRPFGIIFWEFLVKENPILNIIFYESILEPLWIRCINFYFSLSLLFFMNALFFTDDEIDKRSDQPKEIRVKFCFDFYKIFKVSSYNFLDIKFYNLIIIGFNFLYIRSRFD